MIALAVGLCVDFATLRRARLVLGSPWMAKENLMAKKITIKWSEQPEKDDYAAAETYLTLVFEKRVAADSVKSLHKAAVTRFKASDLFRASGLDYNESRVKRERKKILAGKKIAPLLLVRDSERARVIVADGFHRMCAVVSLDDEASIPCKLV